MPVTVELTESSAGWELRISGTDDLVEALVTDPAGAQVTVSIKPSLVPGDPFDAHASIARTKAPQPPAEKRGRS